MKIVIIIDYIYPSIRSGDAMAAVKESAELIAHGYDVAIIRYLGEDI